MMEYKDLNDDELLYMINESDEDAYSLMYDKYKNVIYSLAHKYSKGCSSVGIDINDLIIEGHVGLDTAIKSYKSYDNNDTKFFTFAHMCIERQIIKLIRKATTQKNNILNNSTFFEPSDLENMGYYIEEKDVLNKIIIKEEEKAKYDELIKKLTPLELKIFILKIREYTNKEIAEMLSISYKCVLNTIYRIRKKAKDT